MPTIPASSFVPAASTLANTDFPRSLSASLASAPTVAVSSQAVQALASSQQQAMQLVALAVTQMPQRRPPLPQPQMAARRLRRC